jgi:hypothetical protein
MAALADKGGSSGVVNTGTDLFAAWVPGYATLVDLAILQNLDQQHG